MSPTTQRTKIARKPTTVQPDSWEPWPAFQTETQFDKNETHTWNQCLKFGDLKRA